jgi:hypothetical protein
MSIQKLGRAQLRKMIKLGQGGTAVVTFKLYDSIDYDPDTGQAAEPTTTASISCFLAHHSEQETKSGSVVRATYRLTFADGDLPRRPDTQDEVLIDSVPFAVTGVNVDPMGVELQVFVQQK